MENTKHGGHLTQEETSLITKRIEDSGRDIQRAFVSWARKESNRLVIVDGRLVPSDRSSKAGTYDSAGVPSERQQTLVPSERTPSAKTG